MHIDYEFMKEVADAIVYMVDFAPVVWMPAVCGVLLGYSLGNIYKGIEELHKFYLEWR